MYFPRMGLRLVLRRGDALTWPNVDWETGRAVEDLRTLRVHSGDDGTPALGLDAFFLDHPVREQQRLRTFMHDTAAARLLSH